MRNDDPAGSDKVTRRSECSRAHISKEVVPEIRAVCKVEYLKNQRQCGPLFDPKVLSDSSVELNKRLPTKVVKRNDRTLAGAQTVAITDRRRSECIEGRQKIVLSVIENDHVRGSGAAPGSNYVKRAVAGGIRSRRFHLQDGSNLETARQVKNAARCETMAGIGWGRSVLYR